MNPAQFIAKWSKSTLKESANLLATQGIAGIGTVRYPRIVPKDAASAKHLKKRTLTNLYNDRPRLADLSHMALDQYNGGSNHA